MAHLDQLICRSAPWNLFARRVVLPWALQGVELRGDVLEIGCGSGAMAAEILGRSPDVRVTATDYDQAMVKVAEHRLAGFGSRAHVQRADATSLPFPSESFDAVASFVMLHHVMRWEEALREVARVLRPGGHFVGYDLLGDGLARVVDGDDSRVMRSAELGSVLADLPFKTATTKPGLGRLVVRFTAHK
jgi:ubiquinone/menaquinone biosynthesis C-methylase UbiE